MRCFRYKEDRLPVFLFVTLLGLDLVVYLVVEQLWALVLWMVIGVFLKGFVASWSHHHQHFHTFNQALLNRLLELVHAFHTGCVTNLWVLHHVLGHHLHYLDQRLDENSWRRADETEMGVLEYTMTLAATSYWRAYKVGRAHKQHQRRFLGMTGLFVSLQMALLYFNWVNALLVFVIPMTTVFLLTCWSTHDQHAGLATTDPLHASYNVTHKWYNILSGNVGYHTAHHLKPHLHWSRLPEFHRTLEAQIPAHLYRQPGLPVRWLPAA